MLSFNDTEIAFAYRSKHELKKAKLLFAILSWPILVKIGQILVIFAIKSKLPIAWLIKPTIFKQFIGGETLVESLPVVRNLQKYNVNSILDYSVEGQENEESQRNAYDEILRSIENARGKSAITHVVFKPTGLIKVCILEKVSNGTPLSNEEHQHYKMFIERIDNLCQAASEVDKPLLMDAEDSWYQKALDDICHEMMKKYNSKKALVYNTLQMYRKDRLKFLKNSHILAIENGYMLGIKFVRGAYMEKERERALILGYPSPIQNSKVDTDNDFNTALEYAINNINTISIFCGTHNEESVKLLVSLMAKSGINPNDPRITFSQLYGMSDNISFNLANAGFNVAKYIPYGPVKFVMPYLFRRAQENTSVKGQTNRELMLIKQELKRRKRQI
jgi:proline dehydrogenase